MKMICEELRTNKWLYIALGGVVIVAAFLRLWGLGNTPFVADEFLDVNATYGYHKTGEWQAWDFNHNALSVRDNKASDERAWLYRLQIAWLYDYLEPNEFAVRLVSVLWGILTTLILYFITYSFTKNRWIALMSAFLWAVSVPAIEIDRKIRMYAMFAPLFLLFTWSLFQFIDSRVARAYKITSSPWSRIMQSVLNLRWIYMIPTIIFGFTAYHLHQLTGNIIFIFFSYCIFMYVQQRKDVSKYRYGIYVISMIIGAVIIKIFVPSVWNQISDSLVAWDNHWNYVGHILRNYWHPLMGVIIMIFGGWYLVIKQKDPRAGMWIVSVFVTILFMAIFFWKRNVGPQYIFFAQPFGLMLAAAGVVYIAEIFRDAFSSKKVYIFTLVAGCVFLPYYGYFILENNTYHITADGETVNYRKVFDYVKRNAGEGDVMVTRNFRNYYWSGLDIKVFDFGSERSEEQLAEEGKVRRITMEYMRDIIEKYPSGWVVIADNDGQFVEKEAQKYFDTYLKKIDDSPLVRGDVQMYRWGVSN